MKTLRFILLVVSGFYFGELVIQAPQVMWEAIVAGGTMLAALTITHFEDK